VRLASKGDESVWNELYDRFGPLVVRTANRYGLNDSDASDVAQITWIRLMTNIDELRDPERLPAWLVTTARRESLRLARKARRQVLSADPVEECRGAAGTGSFDVYQFERSYDPALQVAVERLPSRYQDLLQLLMSDAGYSYAEIAVMLGVAVGSIGPMRQRCLQMLRSALATDPGRCDE
jgi:RNA polymerase sigma factor (sigma-70 family)